MILKQQHTVTGLPLVREHRDTGTLYHALPRQYADFTFGRGGAIKQTWVHQWQRWDMDVLQAVRCWKCGRDIKGWRIALDRHGKPVQINKQPAVHFTMLPCFAQTPMRVRWPQLDRLARFSALHCKDCEVTDLHVFEAMTCYLQGVDAQLQRAWRASQGRQLTRDDWASHLYLWRDAEPAGVIKDMDMTNRLATLNAELAELATTGPVRLPVPGEQITAAHYLTDVFAWQFTGVPRGAQMKYERDPVPPGWIRCTGELTDPERWPELAQLYPRLPHDRDYIIKT